MTWSLAGCAPVPTLKRSDTCHGTYFSLQLGDARAAHAPDLHKLAAIMFEGLVWTCAEVRLADAIRKSPLHCIVQATTG